ncbi:hypothetical protein O6H91_18G045100 [Diphasiastrum complanatum]|nr:hypothetical protein O6H91_18G045100 [Diphasiastrum complanatum]
MTIQTAAKGFEISDIVNVPNETQDRNKNLASSYPDHSQKFVRLQNGGQDIHDVERKCSRITLKDILKGQAFSNQTDFSAAVHEASEKENTELAAEQFQNQAAKLQKEKRLLASIFRAKFNSRKESKAKEIGDGTRKRSVSIKKQSFIDLSEKDRNASKAVPKLAERSTSVKDLFYGATFRNLEQGPQTNLTPVKIPPKGSLSLEKLKIGDNGYSTFSPDDLQSTGSTRFDSSITHSFDTAEEQFSGDDCSQESVAVSASSLSDVRSPFKRKCLFEAEKKKLPSRTLSGMVRTSTAESRDTLSIYSRDVTSEIDEVDRMHVETSPLGQCEFLCPPGGEEQVVLYTTSLRGIRKTYEECSSVRTILQGFSVRIDERDISMHSGFKQELKNLLTEPAHVPRLFIKGRHIGGAEEVLRLNENGILIRLLESLPKYVNRELCRGCGGVRFVPCPHCAGSCKIVSEGKKVEQCPNCNENGLIRCPICC